MELFIYLIKVTGCTTAFYLVYHILFRKLTFFTLNRWYVLSALVISLMIPLLHIGIQTTVPAPDIKPLIVNTTTKTISEAVDPVIITQQPHHHTDWMLIANTAYFVIAGLLLLKLLAMLGNILYKGIKYGKRQNGYRLISGRSPNNSSFFRYIFLNNNGLDDSEQEQVIAHELVHARLIHSADNLFTEVLKAILWFNPFVYLFAKALHQSHEFEVDRHLALQYDSKDYAGLLLKLSNPARVGISNQFSAYGLKTRIQVMFGTRSAAVKKLGYLVALPVMAGLIYFLAVERVYAFAEYTGSVKDFVLVLDAGHGGNTGGTSNGVNEQDIALTMVKKIKTIAEQRGIKIILTRTDNTNVPFADRVKPQGDAFVSIHVNSDPDNTPRRSSGMMVLTDRSVNKERSQKLAEVMVSEMQKLTDITMNGEVRHQGIYVLRENKAPAILLELGYLTTKSDRTYLIDPKSQHTIAEKFVDAIISYKNTVKTNKNGMVAVGSTTSHTDAGTDTAIKVKGATISSGGKVSAKKRVNSPNTINITAHESMYNLYNEFKNARFTADSSMEDRKTGAVRFYNAELTSANFNIKADRILYSQKDSLVSANGSVHVKINNPEKPKALPTVLETDSLNIFLNDHPPRASFKKH